MNIGDCPVDINSANARMVAADWFEDQGKIKEASLLRKVEKEIFWANKLQQRVRSWQTQLPPDIAKSLKYFFQIIDAKVQILKSVTIVEFLSGYPIQQQRHINVKITGELLGFHHFSCSEIKRKILISKGITVLQYCSGIRSVQPILYVHPEDSHYFGITRIPAYE